MGIINLSAELYVVFAIGYICGVLLCWSLQTTLYGESKDDESKNHSVDSSVSDRMYSMYHSSLQRETD